MGSRKKQPKSDKQRRKREGRKEKTEREAMAKRKWRILGGKKFKGVMLLIIRCPNDHYWIHELKGYPDHDAIFAKCPECALRNFLTAMFDDK